MPRGRGTTRRSQGAVVHSLPATQTAETGRCEEIAGVVQTGSQWAHSRRAARGRWPSWEVDARHGSASDDRAKGSPSGASRHLTQAAENCFFR